MNKIILILFISCWCTFALAQRYSQYNTGTLYESFENPSTGIYTPDTSRQFAFNFFIPNGGVSSYLKGNAQYTLKSRLFLDKYDSESLEIGQGKINNALLNSNAYLLMFKAFTSLDGEQQIGFSVQSRANARGQVTDETIALLDGIDKFTADRYNNLFNDRGFYEAYHQISATYREKVTKNLSLGFKISGLLGIAYNKLIIDNSSLVIDRTNDNAILALNGTYRSSFDPGEFEADNIKPSFRNPGLSVSMGFTLKTKDNFVIQGNIKDLGFIRWRGDARTYAFNGTAAINNISTGNLENRTGNALDRIIDPTLPSSHFTAPILGRAELSGSRRFVFDPVSYSPTLIASTQLFGIDNISTLALVNHVQYKNFIATLTGSYDNKKIAGIGGQLMYKASNAEFYIGSEQIRQTLNMAGSASKGGNPRYINKKIAYSGADVFLGFSLKFGRILEHPMNASYIPMGEEPGFLGRLWNRLFGKRKGGEL